MKPLNPSDVRAWFDEATMVRLRLGDSPEFCLDPETALRLAKELNTAARAAQHHLAMRATWDQQRAIGESLQKKQRRG